MVVFNVEVKLSGELQNKAKDGKIEVGGIEFILRSRNTGVFYAEGLSLAEFNAIKGGELVGVTLSNSRAIPVMGDALSAVEPPHKEPAAADLVLDEDVGLDKDEAGSDAVDGRASKEDSEDNY